MFLDLLHLLATLDSQLGDHLINATVARYTSAMIQSKLLDCLFVVYREELEKDVKKKEDFVDIKADETTDITCKSQFVIILRFFFNKLSVERFLKFMDVKDRSAQDLITVLQAEFDFLDIKDKLIAQAYDGAAITP